MPAQAASSQEPERVGSGKTKVAVVTDDMKTVSMHFGMARHYLVYHVEAGRVVRRETRDKPGHAPGMHDHRRGEESSRGGADFHNSMLSNVADCSVLIAGGMGTPMYAAISSAGMKAYITRIRSADEAVEAFLAGRLDNHTELLH